MAIDPVVVKFAVAGVAEVDRAFDSILRRIERTETQAEAAAREGGRKRIRQAEEEERARGAAYAKISKAAEQAEKLATKEAEREAKLREARAEKSYALLKREIDKAKRDEVRAAEEAAREIERIEQYKMRVRIRSSEAAGRLAAQEAEKEIAARKRVLHSLGAGAGRGLSAGVGMAKMAMGTLSIGGGFALADIVGSQMRAETTAGLIVNAGTGPGGVAPGTAGQALAAATAATQATGMSKEDVLRGALRYAQSARGGDFGGALANMGFFAKMAKVSGTDIADIGEAAGVLQSQNTELAKDPKKMQQMLLNVLAQSHAGSMSLVDAAKQIGTMGSVRSAFAGDETATQRTLFGIGQIARVGGDVGEAGTFTKDLALEVAIANQKWRERTGGRKVGGKMVGGQDLVSVNEHGQIQSPEEMIAQVFRGTKGNLSVINDLFGKRGSVLFRELEKSYITGEKTGGVEGGVKAALANVSQVSGATMTPEELDKQLKQQLEQPGERVKKAWESLKATTGDKLEPALVKFATFVEEHTDSIAKFGDALEQVAEIFLEHPWASIGTIVGGKIALEVGKAGIGEMLKNTLETNLGKSLASGGLKLAVAGGAVAISAEIINAYVQQLEQAQAGREAAGGAFGQQLSGTAASLEEKVRSGKVTAADIAAAQRVLKVGSQEVHGEIAATPGATEIAGQVFGGIAKGDLTGEGARQAIANHSKTIEENQKKLLQLSAAIDKAAEALARMRFADPARSVPIDHRTGGGS